MPKIPLSTLDVTPAWLTEVLQANGLPHASVSAVAFEPLDSLTSTMHRIRVDYSSPSPDLPATLIWKQSSTDPAVRVAFGHAAGSAYQREIAFYLEVAPTIATRMPRCYLAEYDRLTDEHVLLLEDLRANSPRRRPAGHLGRSHTRRAPRAGTPARRALEHGRAWGAAVLARRNPAHLR